jgi:hypothetical protein
MVFDNFLGKIFVGNLSGKFFLKKLMIGNVAVGLHLKLNEAKVCRVWERELELVFVELESGN